MLYGLLCYLNLCVIADTDTKTFTEVVNDRDRLKEIYEEESNNIWIGYNIRSYDSYILKAILLGIDPRLVNDFIIVQRKKGREYTRVGLPCLNVFDCDKLKRAEQALKGGAE